MKALTLTQPWATLVAVGEKSYETRSWQTPYRGPLAIHAAKGLDPIGGIAGLHRLIRTQPFYDTLAKHLHGYTIEEMAANLPRGCIVATVNLVDITRADIVAKRLDDSNTRADWLERHFGDYAPGRWAWLFEERLQVGDPIPCSGSRGIWDIPADVADRLAEIDDARAAL